MRYKIYFKGNKVGQTDNRAEATRIYIRKLQRLMDEQEYPLYIYDSVEKKKIT